jgi:hypothetical protein
MLRLPEQLPAASTTEHCPRSPADTSEETEITEHQQTQLIDVYAATIPGFPFQPGMHVNYQESVLPLRDGLPKFRDVPAEMGGSGVIMGE